MADAPVVRRVRSRDAGGLDGSITTERSFERFYLPENEWVEVSEPVYQHLKAKFGKPKERVVLDHRANQNNPHAPGEFPTLRREQKPMPIVEGLDD